MNEQEQEPMPEAKRAGSLMISMVDAAKAGGCMEPYETLPARLENYLAEELDVLFRAAADRARAEERERMKDADEYRVYGVATMEDDNRHLRAENERLREALGDIEWTAEDRETGERICPVCERFQAVNHSPTCPIGQALGGGEEEERHDQ